MFWFFGLEALGILAAQPGIKPTPPALEVRVLTLDHKGSPCCSLRFENAMLRESVSCSVMSHSLRPRGL